VRITVVALALATATPALRAQTFRQKDFDAYVARGLQVLRTPAQASRW